MAVNHLLFRSFMISISTEERQAQRSNIEEVVEMGAGENNVHFCHLLGILKLAWYPKSRSVGTIWWADLSSTK